MTALSSVNDSAVVNHISYYKSIKNILKKRV